MYGLLILNNLAYHSCLTGFLQGKVKNFITQGQHDVTKILAHHNDTRTVFYAATLVGSPGERHIFSIPDIHSVLPRIPNCLTCNQTERNCSYNDAIFNSNVEYFILQCLGPGPPWTEVRAIDGNRTSMFDNIVMFSC